MGLVIGPYGFRVSMELNPDSWSGYAERIFNACCLETQRIGRPTSQFHPSSIAVSDGRLSTAPMCSTSNCVPRTGLARRAYAIDSAFTSQPG